VFDKTGTITIGQPRVSRVITANGRGPNDALRLAGAIERTSGHLLARTFVVEQTPGAAAALCPIEPKTAGLRAYVAVDDAISAIVEYADALRPGVSDVFRDLARMGVKRIMLLSGDHAENARTVAAAAGIVEVQGDLLPEGKVAVVRHLVQDGESVLMVGDGTNDAPALSAATVGVALAGHGGGITAEAADVVVLIDDLTRV